MLKYLLKNNYCRSKTLYICHSYFSIQNVNKTISRFIFNFIKINLKKNIFNRTLKSVASNPLQIVNFCVLRCYRGFLRIRALVNFLFNRD